jgi:hypothetical protein
MLRVTLKIKTPPPAERGERRGMMEKWRCYSCAYGPCLEDLPKGYNPNSCRLNLKGVKFNWSLVSPAPDAEKAQTDKKEGL